MPDSPTATTARPPKRQRLIDGARELIHEQGVQRTTLAQIAERADVPRGNVYYDYKQFRELARRDAPALAVTLLASIQGAALLANTLRDEDLFHREIRRSRRSCRSRSRAGRGRRPVL